MITLNAFILNCINVPNYASDRGISAEHLGSKQKNGQTWQRYLIDGASYRVRCSHNSQFNNICEIDA